jgi:hypothetical protein
MAFPWKKVWGTLPYTHTLRVSALPPRCGQYVLVAEQEFRENLVEVLSFYFPDYSFEKLFHCRFVSKICVFPRRQCGSGTSPI